jgi:hypothetical protein
MSLWKVWWAGYCYGPRLIAPVIPFLLLGIVEVIGSLPRLSRAARRIVLVTTSLSLAISTLGAVLHMAFWAQHPLITPIVLLLRRV